MISDPSNNQTVITDLQQEVSLLRSFVIGLAGKDREGKYRPEFVRRTLQALKEKATKRFLNPKAFLSDLSRVIFQFRAPNEIVLVNVGHRKEIYQ